MRARAYGFVFERHQRSAAIFSLRSCTACARVLSLCMRLPARARPPATAWLLSDTRRQRRKVDKCRVADKKKTDRQTNKHTLLFYRPRYILAYHAEPCSATVPRQYCAAEKQTWKLSPSFSPLPTHVTWRASSNQAQTSWAAELPVPCTHFFFALSLIMAGYVGVPCSYQQTLQNKGDHQQMQQLVHNNKTFQVGERSRFQSPESGPKHEAGRLTRIIIMWHGSKLYLI